MFRSRQNLLSKLSILLILIFTGLLIAYQLSIINNRGWGFIVALFASFTISAYLDGRCKLNLSFGNNLWRSISFSTTIAIFCILLALLEIESFLQALNIQLLSVILVYLIPLTATWALLLRSREGNHTSGRRMAYIHMFSIILLCGYWALEKNVLLT